MSCSGEFVEKEQDLIQIKPNVMKQLKKAKYGVADHSTVELCHWTKKSFRDEGTCYKHKFLSLIHIYFHNAFLQEKIPYSDVY